MNKVIFTALIAGGLLLLDSPEAAAHKEVRSVYAPSAYYHMEHRRAHHMPRWLKRNKSFRRWYKRSHLRRYRHLAWHRLYNIYLWERHSAWNHRRHDHRHYGFDEYRYDDFREYDDRRDRRDRDRRGKRRHRD